MDRLITIGARDTAAVSEVLEVTYRLARDSSMPKFDGIELKTPEDIGISPVCFEMGDFATRAALDLGILASREAHVAHYITSFAPLNTDPSPQDLILCLTWGQFNPQAFRVAYFGLRQDIQSLVRSCYASAYGPESTRLRQVTHTGMSSLGLHSWLKTTPEQIARRNYPIGPVNRADYPDTRWEDP